MKLRQASLFLPILMLLTTAALPQMPSTQTATDQPTSVAVARCRYTPNEEACRDQNADQPGVHPDATTLAQLPRRSGPPLPPRRPPMRPAYPHAAPMPTPSGRHILIGGIIGFALGAAHPNDGTVRGHLALGMIVGLVGAGIGAAIPSFPSHSSSLHRRLPDEDAEASRTRPSDQPPSAPGD